MSRQPTEDASQLTAPRRFGLPQTFHAACVGLWQWLIPEPLREPPERLQQANRVLAFCLATWGWVPLFAVVYVILQGWPCVWLLAAAGILLTAIPLVQRATHRPTLAGNLLILFGAATYAGLACLTGGHIAPTIQWYVSVPVAAVLLAGVRWGLFWTAASAVIIGAFYAAGELGYRFPVVVSPRGLLLLHGMGQTCILACIFALTLVFRSVERNHQRALEHALRLATAADRAKSEFLANMSHEIRTPMTAILGFAELLLDARASDKSLGDDASRDALDTIHRNGQHLLGVINDILDLSKIESGKLEVERLWASPRQIVDEVAELMRVRADAKGLRIDARVEGTLPDAIETDPTRLRQVLINLLGNAIKFTETGAVRLTTRWRSAGEGGALEFEIVDTGIGMSEEQIGRLFQPFSQADMSMTRRFGGTGLGLSISQRLTEMLGGSIEVRSRLGEGSTFLVRLPVSHRRSRAAASDHHPPKAAAAPVARAVAAGNVPVPENSPTKTTSPDSLAVQPLTACRILLAEDCADNQRLIGHLLRRAGADLELAVDGQRAVAAVYEARDRRQPFDVILMDMQMPVLSGCQATRRLRADGYPGPIIALTAFSTAAELRECLEAGCDEIASKPVDRAALIGAIQRQLERKLVASG